MDLKAVIFFLVLTIISDEKVEGRRNKPEKKEDIEFERYLRILNEPGIKTVETEYGDVYSCVDIYKQPAFNHPLLKDHKIPEGYLSKMETLNNKPSRFGLKEGCPLGTVPIRNVTKEDLIRAKSVFKMIAGNYSQKVEGRGFEFAGFHTIKSPGRVYHGAGANLNLYNPKIQSGEFSSSMISIESGPPNEVNFIQFGWTVNPGLYRDDRTRLFTLWTNGDTGCFNAYCSGFIHLNRNAPLDYAFEVISKVDKEQYDERLVVSQDSYTKAWLFKVNDGDEKLVGYWPPKIFTHLASQADYIQYGGQVFSPDPESHSPEMGSGTWVNGWYGETCYFRKTIYIDATYKTQVPDNNNMQKAYSRCYEAGDNYYKDDFWGYSFVFGGPGGPAYDCFG